MRPIHANELLAGLALAPPGRLNAGVTPSRRGPPRGGAAGVPGGTPAPWPAWGTPPTLSA